VGLVWGLQMVWGLGVSLWSEDEQGRRNAGALFGLGLMAVGSLGWLAGRMLQAAVSRQREFLADASAVKFARDVEGLGGALRKIADQQARHVKGLASAHAASLAHLLLNSRSSAPERSWGALLATHPPLAERLARLYERELSADELLLTADPVPLEAADAQAEAFVPQAFEASRASRGPRGPRGPHASPPDAHAHDAFQVPAFHDAAEREREALQRIERWHGPGEWQAAMLALAIESHATAGVAHRWRAYEQVTSDLSVSAAVRREIAALGAVQRRRVFESLLQRGASAPLAARRRLWREWSGRWRAMLGDEQHGAALSWRALVIRHALDGAPRAVARGTLATHHAEAVAATRAFAACLDATAEQQQAWCEASLAALQALGLPAPRGPGSGLAPAMRGRERFAALRVRHLSPMQRPLLLRAWVDAARSRGLLANASTQASTADAFYLACVALAVPVPEALLGSR
jgi:Peptidase family M48